MMRISWIFRFEASSSSSNDQEVINHTTAHELVHPHNLNRPLDHTSSSIKPIHHHLNLHSYDWSIRSTPSHQATSDTSKSPIELKTSNQGLKCIYHRSSLKPLIPCSPLIIPSTSNRDQSDLTPSTINQFSLGIHEELISYTTDILSPSGLPSSSHTLTLFYLPIFSTSDSSD